MLVLVTGPAPGAIHSTIREFTGSDATSVPTVSDRTEAYDAIGRTSGPTCSWGAAGVATTTTLTGFSTQRSWTG